MRYEIGFWILVFLFIGKSVLDHDKISDLEKQKIISDSIHIYELNDKIFLQKKYASLTKLNFSRDVK